MKSFNYDGGVHLAHQRQNICFRREEGKTQICYSAATATDFEISKGSGRVDHYVLRVILTNILFRRKRCQQGIFHSNELLLIWRRWKERRIRLCDDSFSVKHQRADYKNYVSFSGHFKNVHIYPNVSFSVDFVATLDLLPRKQ